MGNIVLILHRNISAMATRSLQKKYIPTSNHHYFHLEGKQQNWVEKGYDENQDLKRTVNIENTRIQVNWFKININIFICLFYKRK